MSGAPVGGRHALLHALEYAVVRDGQHGVGGSSGREASAAGMLGSDLLGRASAHSKSSRGSARAMARSSKALDCPDRGRVSIQRKVGGGLRAPVLS